jgi:hypothetical protein
MQSPPVLRQLQDQRIRPGPHLLQGFRLAGIGLLPLSGSFPQPDGDIVLCVGIAERAYRDFVQQRLDSRVACLQHPCRRVGGRLPLRQINAAPCGVYFPSCRRRADSAFPRTLPGGVEFRRIVFSLRCPLGRSGAYDQYLHAIPFPVVVSVIRFSIARSLTKLYKYSCIFPLTGLYYEQSLNGYTKKMEESK